MNIPNPVSIGCTLTAVSLGMCSGTVSGSVTITLHMCEKPGRKEMIEPTNEVAKSSLEKIEIYPNPTDGSFIVQFPAIKGKGEIEITDIYGKIIERQSIGNIENQSIQFDLSNKARGIYMIRIRTDEGIFNEKVIVK